MTCETSAAASANFFGSERSVTIMLMFLRFEASSSRGAAVPRLRMRANIWLFGSLDFDGSQWLVLRRLDEVVDLRDC